MKAYPKIELYKKQIEDLSEILGNLGIPVIESIEDIEEYNFNEDINYYEENFDVQLKLQFVNNKFQV